MSLGVHERRTDTGFTSAQLGLYLFLAADAMFYGALYSSFALLRVAAEHWDKGHGFLIGGFGGAALVALVVAALLSRWAAAGHAAATLLLGALGLALGYRGAPPAASTYFALVYLFSITTLLHTVIGAVVAVWLGTLKNADAPARAGLLRTYTAASAVFWAIALGLLCFG